MKAINIKIIILLTLYSTDIASQSAASSYGDAPSSYGTAIHYYVSPYVRIGGMDVDKLQDFPQYSSDANTALNDDGLNITLSGEYTNISSTDFNLDASGALIAKVAVYNSTTNNAKLIGWIDFNRNGVFDAAEASSTMTVNANTSTPATVNLQWANANTKMRNGITYMRLRISTDNNLTAAKSQGLLSNGEAEDYKLNFNILDLSKTALSNNRYDASHAMIGDTITYTINLVNKIQGNVTVFDPIPLGTEYVAGSANNSGTSTTANLYGATNISVIKWNLGNKSAGAVSELKFKVRLTSYPAGVDSVFNIAYAVMNSDTIPSTGNACDMEIITVDGPRANNDMVSALLNTPVTINVLANDDYPCSPQLSIIQNSYNNRGVATLASGQILYTPANGQSGVDSILYQLKCSDDRISTAKVYVIISNPLSLQYLACPDATVTMGFSAISGVTYHWYNAETGGSIVDNGNSQNTLTITKNATADIGAWWVEPRHGSLVFPRHAVSLTANPVPAPTITTDKNTVCIGSTLQLTGSNLTNGTWSSSNGSTATVSESGLVTGVAAGTVTISYTVTNSSGCTAKAEKTITVNANPTLTVSNITVTNVACYGGSTGSITVSGVTGASDFSKDNGSSWLSNSTFSGLAASTYNIKVRTSAGCVSNVVPVEVTQPAALNAGTIGSAQTICYNTTPATFSETTAPSGGMGADTYTYKWQSSTDNSNWSDISLAATDATYTPGALTANTYFRRAVTSGSCGTAYSASVLVTVRADLTAGAIGSEQTICYNTAPATFSETTAPSGGMGTGTYAYKWQSSTDNSSWSDISPAATSATYTSGALTANTYFRRAVTSGSCGTKYSASVLVTVRADLTAGAIGSSQTICYGATPATFSQSSAPSGGMGAGTYTYKWQSSTDNSNWNDISPTATDASYTHTTALTANTYFRRAVTSGSCGTAYSSSVIVTVNALPNAPTNPVNDSCCGSGTVTLTATVPGNHTIDWYADASGGSVLDGGTGVTSFSPSLTTSTTYYAQSRSTTTGCVSATRLAVTGTVNPVPAAPVANNITKCYDGTTYTASATVGEDQTVVWYTAATNGNTTNAPSSNAVGTITAYAAAKTKAGCESATRTAVSLTINAVPSPTITTDNNAVSVCAGSTLQLTGGNPTNGTWSSSNVSTATVNESGLVTGVAAGTVTISYTFTNASNCTAKAEKIITVYPKPSLTAMDITVTNVACYGGSTGSITVSGVTGASDFSKDNGSSWLSNSTFSGLAASTYNIKVRTSAGCVSNVVPVDVTQPAALNAGTIGSAQTICYNTTPATFAETTAPSGGMGAGTYTYKWQSSTDDSNWSDISPAATDATYTHTTALTANTYFRRAVTSGSCGTAYTASVLVAVRADLTAGTIGSAQTICYNTAPATFSETTAPSGGVTGEYAYKWQSSTDDSNWSDISPAATNVTYTHTTALTANTYFRRAVTSGSCGTAYTASVLVTVRADLTAGTIGSEQTICYGATPATFSQSSAPSGGMGTGTYAYKWQSSTDNSNWIDISPAATDASYTHTTALTTTTYFRRAVTSGSCGTVSSNSVTVTVNALPNAPTNPVNDSCCGSGTVTLTATVPGNHTIDWYADASGGSVLDGGTGVTSFSPSLTTSTTYYAQSRSTTTGCVSATRLAVTGTVNLIPAAPVASNITKCYDGTTYTAGATVGEDQTVVWYAAESGTNPASAPSSNAVGTITAYAAAKTKAGCESATRTAVSLTINAVPSPTITTDNNAVSVCAGSTLQLTGGNPTNGTWSSSNVSTATVNESGLVTGVAAGTVTISYTFTNASDCTAKAEKIITVYPKPSLTAMDITVTNVACYGGSTGSITVMTGLKNYNRDNGSTWQPSNVFSGLIADSYNIRVESENGCISDAIPVTISQPEAALDGLSTVINSVCNGGTGTITIDASGGTPSYNYKLNTDADYKTGNTFTVPAGTNYSVTIRDNNNCEMTITGITVTQPEALNAGTIGSAQTICYGATPATFSQSSAPSGGMGTGTYTYKWQSSTDDSNWSDISPAATDATYTHTTALTANTYFRRAVTSGSCGTEYSSPVTVTVNALPNAPAADNIMKCYDGTTYTAGATVGADQTVVWYAAESGTNPASEPSRSAVGTTTAYAAAKITATGCESAARTAVYVHIVEKFVAPDIRLQICTSPPGRTVQLTSYLDSTDYDKVQWEQVSPYPLVSNTETGLITDGYFHENSIYTYKYTLLSPEYSGCGSTSAQVYIRPQSNRIFGKTVDTITICSALAVSRFVNLNQIFGLELGGVWSYPNDDPACIAQNNVTQSISPSKYAGAMVFNAQNAYAEAETNDNYSIIYKGTPAKKFDFVYTASCVTATKRVTLIVTE